MDGEDLLASLETVYVLPNDALTFVTSREFSPDVTRYFQETLEKIFPTQQVHLISGVHKVLIRREPLATTETSEARRRNELVDATEEEAGNTSLVDLFNPSPNRKDKKKKRTKGPTLDYLEDTTR
jgi:hypothetical protein